MSSFRLIILAFACAGFPLTLPGEEKKTEEIEIEAKLIEATKPPTAKDVLPYRRALATSLYRVKKVKRGRYVEEKVLVVRWVVWEGKEVKGATGRKKVQTEKLRLARLDTLAAFKNDFIADDIRDRELPLYLDLDSMPAKAAAKNRSAEKLKRPADVRR